MDRALFIVSHLTKEPYQRRSLISMIALFVQVGALTLMELRDMSLLCGLYVPKITKLYRCLQLLQALLPSTYIVAFYNYYYSARDDILWWMWQFSEQRASVAISFARFWYARVLKLTAARRDAMTTTLATSSVHDMTTSLNQSTAHTRPTGYTVFLFDSVSLWYVYMQFEMGEWMNKLINVMLCQQLTSTSPTSLYRWVQISCYRSE